MHDSSDSSGPAPRPPRRHRRRSPQEAVGPAAAGAGVPLSMSQLSIWMEAEHQVDRSLLSPFAFRLEGPHDADRLLAALHASIAAHDLLRCLFAASPEPHLRPEAWSPPIEVVDVRSNPDPELIAQELIAQDLRAGCDPQRAPHRFKLIQLQPQVSLLVWIRHALVGDGWSLGVFLDTLVAHYEQDLAWTSAPSFLAHAVDERQAWAEPAPARIAWWAERLPGEGGAQVRLAGGTRASSPAEVRLAEPVVAAVERLAREGGSTPFALYLSVWGELVRRLVRQDALVLSTLDAARRGPKEARLVGRLSEVVLLPLRLDPTASLLERMAQTTAVWHDVLGTYWVPRAALARALPRPAAPWASSLLVVQNLPPSTRHLGAARLTPVPLPGDAGQQTLSMYIDLVASKGTALLVHNGTGLDAAAAGQVVRWYATLLGAAVASPDVPMSRLRLLSEEEEQSLAGWERGAGLRPQAALPVVQVLRVRAQQMPSRPALYEGQEVVSLGELLARAEKRAEEMAWRGVGPGQVVAIHLPRSIELVVNLLAVMFTGAAFFVLDPLLLSPARREELAGAAGARVSVGAAGEAGAPALAPGSHRPPSGQDLAYVMCTSGSTGGPLAVLATHDGLAHRIAALHAQAPWAEHEVGAFRTNTRFVDFVAELFEPLVAGRPVAIFPSGQDGDVAALAAFVQHHRVTRLVLVPTLLRALLEFSEQLTTLQAIHSSGEPLSAMDLARVRQHLPGCTLRNLYGSTEVAADATCGEPTELPHIGTPLPGAVVRLLDAEGVRVAVGVVGEVYVGGTGLSWGYLGQPAYTARRFVPDPFARGQRLYQTGDLAVWRPDGTLALLGRADRQVKIRGERVDPAEVEGVLAAHPAIEAAAVQGSKTAGASALVAHLVLRRGQSLTRSQLVAWLLEHGASSWIPSEVRLVEVLARLSTGKTDYRRLLAQPSTPLGEAGERVEGGWMGELAALWAELLPRRPEVGEDDFFALGGHSMRMVELRSRLMKAHPQLQVSLAELYAHRRLSEMARLLAARLDSDPVEPPLDRPASPGPVALTPVQQAYWIGRETALPLGGTATHTYFELQTTEVSVAPLQAAWNVLIERHDALRMVVDADGQLRVLSDVPVYEVRVGAATEHAAWRAQMSHRVHAPDQWPLFEVRAIVEPSGTLRLLAEFDMLMLDASSLRLLLQQWWQLLGGARASRWPPAGSFLQYLAAATARRPPRSVAVERTYPPPAHLPQRLGTPGPQVHREVRTVEAQVWSTVLAHAGRHDIRGVAVAIAAFLAVAAYWSGTDSVSIVVPLAGRRPWVADVQRMVGQFTEISVVGATAIATTPFHEVARAVSEQLWRGLEGEAPSAVEQTRHLAARRGELVPHWTVATTVSADWGEPQALPAGVELAYALTQTSQLVLDNMIAERAGELLLTWDYRADALDPEVVLGMLEAYEALLAALASPEAWEGPCPVRLPAGQRQRRREANHTHEPCRLQTLHQAFLEQAKARPQAVALCSGSEQWTYGALGASSQRLAAALQQAGVGPGDRVVLELPRGASMIIAQIAVLRCGAAFVPLDPQWPSARKRAVLTKAAAVAVVSGKRGPWMGEVTLVAPGGTDCQAFAEVHPTPHDLAYVLFTSGSTGEPKGVAISHAAAWNTIQHIHGRLEVTAADCILGFSAPTFDLSIYDVFGSLAVGARLVVVELEAALDPPRLWEVVAREGVTVWNSVPAAFGLFLDGAPPEARLDALRWVLLSGDWVPVQIGVRLRALSRQARVVSLGGATEGAIWSIAHPLMPEDAHRKSVPYGRPLGNQRIYVLDELDRECPDTGVGEICIGGAGVAWGYWRDPRRTALAFRPHPQTGERLYRTGDLGRWQPEGWVEFLGRRDGQVKIAGYRVELGDVEGALRAHPSVEHAIAVAVGDPPEPRRLHAFVTLRAPGAPAALLAFLRESLPPYAVPQQLVVLDELPQTAQGKIDRQRLAAQARPARPSPAATEAGAGPQARALALLRQVTGIADLREDDNLLERGLGSIELVRCANALERTFGVRPRLAEVFAHPTVQALVAAAQPGQDARLLPSAPATIDDPHARDRFKARRLARRSVPAVHQPPRALAAPAPAQLHMHRLRRSHHLFAAGPLTWAQLGDWLVVLSAVPAGEGWKFRYGSAGGAYAVQTYLQVKEHAVEGLAPGVYYFDPYAVELHAVRAACGVQAGHHVPLVNAPKFEQAGLSVFLVLDRAAMEPLYGARCVSLGTLEAGAMSQLLEESAVQAGLAICAIGQIDAQAVEQALALEARHMLLHSLLAGPRSEDGLVRDEGWL
jgi:amino acid adenylation domain-containing protein